MVSHAPKIPAWIEAEIHSLIVMTNTRSLDKLRERRQRPNGVSVDIYHHSDGTDSYYCDIRKKYLTWREVMQEANIKIACGQYLFTSVIEYKSGIHFVSGLTKEKTLAN